MKLIVGLGNPGKEYVNTRHNVGFSIIDHYLGDVKYKSKFEGLYYEKIINGEKIIFLKPQTYMNNSGKSVFLFVNFFNVNISDILIIRDDLDLNIGQIRFKINSSSGGHNGIKSIIQQLSSENFVQLKIGINNEYKNDTIDFVIGNFSINDKKSLDYTLFDSCINDFLNFNIEKLESKYNCRK